MATKKMPPQKKTLADLLGDEDLDPRQVVVLPRWLVRLLMGAAVTGCTAVGWWGTWVSQTLWEQNETMVRLQVSIERIENEVCRYPRGHKTSTIRGKEPLTAPGKTKSK